MALAKFNSAGDLPEGIHRATLQEVLARFGGGVPQRQKVTATLAEVYRLARATNKLERLIIFGSYVTEKPAPRDVDIVLVMRDDFDMRTSDEAMKSLFDHRQAQQRFGASIFWIRPGLLINEPLESFVAHWQIKRNGGRRGIVEVIP